MSRPSLPIQYAGPILLTIPVLVLTLAFAILANWQSERSTQALSSEIVERIAVGLDRQVRTDLQTAVGVTDHMAKLVASGILDSDELGAWRPTLRRHLAAYEGINSVVFGTADGTTTWVIRYPHETVTEYALHPNSDEDVIVEHVLREDGSFGELLGRYSFDARDRPWFQAALEAEEPTWSDVYAWVRRDGGISALGMARVRPVYQPDGRLIGVVSVDVGLAEVSQFLRDGQIPAGGVAFLSEPDGSLIASSAKIPLIGPGGRRVPAVEAADPLLAHVASTREAGDSQADGRLLTFEGGYYIVRSIPLETPWGFAWTLTLAVPKAELTGSVQDLRRRTWWAGGIVAVAMLGLGILLSRTIVRPIGRLSKAVSRIGEGELETEVDIRGWREFRSLSTEVNRMARDLRDRMRLRHALNVAMEVQQQLLPANTPEVPGLDIAAESTFCDETGGDYFDFLELGPTRDDELLVVLGDVMGHGISAALLMATARGFLRSGAAATESLGALLEHVNKLLAVDTGGERFMTMLVLIANGEKHTLRWSSAGQDPAIVYSARQDQFLELEDAGGLPLGIMEEESYPDVTQTGLETEDILVVATDGLWETHNADGDEFGKDRVRAILRARKSGSAKEIATALTAGLAEFRGSIHAQDDVTFVVVKFQELGGVDQAAGTGAEVPVAVNG